ncbi:MAG: hypothetical protein AB8G22_05860 [Saprospiraceae bacterium]
MMQKFTPNDLIRFIYKETSASETLAIMDALVVDEQLATAYEDLTKGFSQFPKVTFAPKASSISNILNYSRQTSFEAQL